MASVILTTIVTVMSLGQPSIDVTREEFTGLGPMIRCRMYEKAYHQGTREIVEDEAGRMVSIIRALEGPRYTETATSCTEI